MKKADVLELLKRYIMDEGQSDKLDYETFKAAVADKLSERTPQVGRIYVGQQWEILYMEYSYSECK